MDALLSLLVFLSLPHLVVPAAPSSNPLVTSFRASIQLVSESSRIFSGGSLQLRCSVPDFPESTWRYRWFRGSEQLPQTGETIRLWNVHVKESGKFSCQGVRDTAMGNLKTKPSLPVEVVVDGGWAILQAPRHPVLVGETMTLQCHLRGNFPVHETILYRNGVEVMRQNGYNSHFRLAEATVEDDGMYSCRASWDVRQRTHSVISAGTPVHVVEVLSEPVLEIDADAKMGPDKMKLICHVEYHARAPAPPINFYFYKNNNLMGPAVSENHNVFRRAPGWYSCRAKVPQLDLVQWSKARSFGDVPGTQMPPPRPHVRSFKPLASSKSPPGHRLTPAAQLTRSQRLAATPSVSERSLHRAFGAPSRFELPKPSSPSTDQFSNQSPPPRPFIVSQDDD